MLHWFAKRLQELQKAKREEKGFTLIELLVVVIIIGILAAIAIPTFLNQRAKAQDSEAASAARNAASQMGSISTACQGKYVMPPGCTTDITFTNVSTEADGGDPALAKYAAAPYNGVITVATDDKSFTAKVTSKSGKNAVFSSTTGEVAITP